VIVAVTGHRPERWKTEEERAAPRVALFRALNEIAPTLLLSGMARGVDQWACGWILQTDDAYWLGGGHACRTKLRAVYPFYRDDARWDYAERHYRQWVVERVADQGLLESEVTVSESAHGAYHARNRYLVDNCDVLVAVYDGGPGGTKYTVDYARKVGCETRMVAW